MNLGNLALTLIVSLPIVIGGWILSLRYAQRCVAREVEFADAKVLNIGIQFGFRQNTFVVRYKDNTNRPLAKVS